MLPRGVIVRKNYKPCESKHLYLGQENNFVGNNLAREWSIVSCTFFTIGLKMFMAFSSFFFDILLYCIPRVFSIKNNLRRCLKF